MNGLNVTRRRLLTLLSLGAGAMATAAASVPIIGFLISPMLRKFPPLWQNVGPLDKFKIGDTVQVDLVTSGALPWDGPADRIGAWLRRDNEQSFTVYSSKCTHLGCPVRWIPSAELFMCPCHGGVYFKDGDVAAGPPPKPLQRFPSRIVGGQVQVQWKSEQVQYAGLIIPSGCGKAPNKDDDDKEKEEG
ncbi:MAG: ubiquinol-cytochrome c reductase iron-sulfur subunit [Terriglobales bacterium]